MTRPDVTRPDVTRPDDALLREIEQTAVELARLAGTEIVNALGRTLAIRYKSNDEQAERFRDPVSEVDGQVETLIRARVAERFTGHDVLGEESEERPSRDSDWVWAIDPIDGTTNFINGFPLFAASIGVLHRGRPLVGAVWCSTTHALRAGVYHARAGGLLCFEGEAIRPNLNPAVRRRLAGDPVGAIDAALPWEARRTGSAAIECAFVAAGLLRVTRFRRPNVWDVAGGIALVQAAGGDVRVREGEDWVALEGFVPPAAAERVADLRDWHASLVLGEPDGVRLVCGTEARA